MSVAEMPEKRAVRRAFDRAAKSYDSAAVLQREIGQRMLERLSLFRLDPRYVLDAGSGTGQTTAALARRYPRADILELDLAPMMLRQSQKARRSWFHRLPGRGRRFYVCADNERLPLRAECVDLLWSNLAFQWASGFDALFREANRVIRSDGLLLFSTFGPDTLRELRSAFAAADDAVHVNRFVDMHDIGDLLIQSGFADPVMDMELITMTYADPRELMRELKSIGARNVNVGRRRSLMGRHKFAEAIEHYENLRDAEGRIPATFEVVYGHAWKPAPRRGPGGRRVIDVMPVNHD